MRNEMINYLKNILEEREKLFDADEEEMLVPGEGEGDDEEQTPTDGEETPTDGEETPEETPEAPAAAEGTDHAAAAREKLSVDLENFGYIEYLEKVAKGEVAEAGEILKNGYPEAFPAEDVDSNEKIKVGAAKANAELGIDHSVEEADTEFGAEEESCQCCGAAKTPDVPSSLGLGSEGV